MPFKDEQEIHKYLGGIFVKAFADPEVGPKMTEAGLVVRFVYTDPAAVLVVDMPKGVVHYGESPDSAPVATMSLSADTANGFWQGKVNLPFALARGKVKVEGNIASLLKLAPLSKKLIPAYIETLKQDGRDDLLV